MSDFGDYDPEDAWDDGDSDDAKLDILARVLESLRGSQGPRTEARRVDAIRLISKMDTALRGRRERLSELRAELEAL